MEHCPFCVINAKGLPRHALLEDGECFVILDRESLAPGHCMVIARRHVPTVYELPESEYRHVFDVARWLAPRLALAAGTKAVGYVAFGTGLSHAHLHLVPMDDDSVLLVPRPTLVGDEELAASAGELRAQLAI
jgi:histidine triad (HIT) family protein